MLTLPEPMPGFGDSEGPGGVVYIEDREAVRTCTIKWDILTESALSQPDLVHRIAVRNSKHPGAGTVFFTPAEMDAWIRGCKAGEFDDLI